MFWGVFLNHRQLCLKAADWLLRRRRCAVVATRKIVHHYEEPDAIGWTTGGVSTLVECKTSRSDFFRDAGKSFRKHPAMGMGQYRFFLTPKGLIEFDEVPTGWGLVEVRGERFKVVRTSERFQHFNRPGELSLLVARAARGPEGWERITPSLVSDGDGI